MHPQHYECEIIRDVGGIVKKDIELVCAGETDAAQICRNAVIEAYSNFSNIF